MSQKRYSTFRVCDSDTGRLANHLAEELNSLSKYGWTIERIDFVNNEETSLDNHGIRRCLKHEYIILASCENNIDGDT